MLVPCSLPYFKEAMLTVSLMHFQQAERFAMPMAANFWGDYFGMCADKFGINWMMSFNENPKQEVISVYF